MRTLTALEAHTLWTRSGHDPFLFAQQANAMRTDPNTSAVVYEVDDTTGKLYVRRLPPRSVPRG